MVRNKVDLIDLRFYGILSGLSISHIKSPARTTMFSLVGLLTVPLTYYLTHDTRIRRVSYEYNTCIIGVLDAYHTSMTRVSYSCDTRILLIWHSRYTHFVRVLYQYHTNDTHYYTRTVYTPVCNRRTGICVYICINFFR